jgi:putative spermidine/putrescine transport system ATP-binding protein
MIAGFIDPTEGEIFMDGAPISDLPPHRRNIGMVFQHYALFPHMTAVENIAFPLKRRKVSRAETRTRVRSALELVDLEHVGDRYPRQLSGGQQQRVALARAIVFSPRVLLMDEPLGALDRKLRESLQLEIKRIHRELGITFVYVTHDQEEALVLSDRIAVYRAGRIEQVGTPDELYERPRTLFVAEFLGESNVFHGWLDQPRGVASVFSGAHRFGVRTDQTAHSGTAVAVLLRPEHVHVHVGRCDAADYDVRLPGLVEHVIYLGSTRRLTVRLDDAKMITARELSKASSGAAEGERVTVSWSADDCIVLPQSEADPRGAIGESEIA